MTKDEMPDNHVHDCTGPDQTCPCGYKFTVPRFSVSVEIYDNQTKRMLVNHGLNISGTAGVKSVLYEAIDLVMAADGD